MTSIKAMREMARKAYLNKASDKELSDVTIDCRNKGVTHERPVGSHLTKGTGCFKNKRGKDNVGEI